jgi:CheY-like chemotaxis protein
MNKPDKHHTILWADDDLDDLMVMREVLGDIDSSHEIIEVDNGRKVLDYLHRVKLSQRFPCLIVLDMNMPVLSGRETLVALKADPVLSTIPVVIFTTSSSELDRLFCRQFGVDMMTKPLTFSGMKEVVAKLFNLCAVAV